MKRTSFLVVLSLIVAAGCGDAGGGDEPPGDDAHDHTGPHGGAVLHAGSAHLEVVHDAVAGTVTLHVLGGDVKTPLRIKLPPELRLRGDGGGKALPTTAVDGTGAGASTFTVTDEILKTEKLVGRVTLEINGKIHNPDLQQ